jgi:hypothetical protein
MKDDESLVLSSNLKGLPVQVVETLRSEVVHMDGKRFGEEVTT